MATTEKSKPWAATHYSPAIALEFFKVAGKVEKVPSGQAFFAENEKARPFLFMRDKMYLLLDGNVDLVARKRVIGTINKGQIFGEMASITHAPRSASGGAPGRRNGSSNCVSTTPRETSSTASCARAMVTRWAAFPKPS